MLRLFKATETSVDKAVASDLKDVRLAAFTAEVEKSRIGVDIQLLAIHYISRDRCYAFTNIFRQKFGENLAVCPGGVVYIVVSSLPATEDTGDTGSEIESRQGIGW
jgi:hypothetical protein